MHKIYLLIAVCIALSGCATAGRDDFYTSIDSYLQQSQSCEGPNSFIECQVPLMRKTLEPAWINYAGKDDTFTNFYSRVDEIQNQKNNGQLNAELANSQYKKALSELIAAIEIRDTALVRQQERVANALMAAGQGMSAHNQYRNSGGYVAQSNSVYREDECVGPVIMGRCHGSVIDKGGYHPTCHGEWLNGQCTGPMF